VKGVKERKIRDTEESSFALDSLRLKPTKPSAMFNVLRWEVEDYIRDDDVECRRIYDFFERGHPIKLVGLRRYLSFEMMVAAQSQHRYLLHSK
jgi:hypothetical protein